MLPVRRPPHNRIRIALTCSDIDVLSFYLSGLKPSKVQSFGSVGHFKPSKKPKEAGDAKRCGDCAYASECVWEAKKIYVDPLSQVEDSQRVRSHSSRQLEHRPFQGSKLTCSGPSISLMLMFLISRMLPRPSRPAHMVDACTNAETISSIIKLSMLNMKMGQRLV
jgi:hypothetical protein